MGHNHHTDYRMVVAWSDHIHHADRVATSVAIYRRRFDSEIRVTRTAGDGRKEGAKHIQTYSPSQGRKSGQRGVNGVWGVGLVG